MEKTTPEKMSKRAGIPVILKKLKDLKSELTDVFRLAPPTGTPDDLRHEISFDDIVQRFDFLKNLYAAEVSSHSDTDEQREIAKRIKDLEHTFHHWNASRTSHYNADESRTSHYNADEALSVCSSCTQKLLFDEERDESDSSVSPPEDLYVDSSSPVVSVREDFSNKELPEKGGDAETNGEAMEERIWRNICRFCGVFGSGVIFGAIFVVIVMNSSDFPQSEVFLHLPPT